MSLLLGLGVFLGLVLLILYMRFMLWIMLSPDQALVFALALLGGTRWLGESLTSSYNGQLIWGLVTALLCCTIYIALLINLHKAYRGISRIVNFLLVVPLAGMGAYYTAKEFLADYLPTLADDPSINGGIYTTITVILGILVWRRRVTKLDEAVRRFAPARTEAPFIVKAH